MEHPLSLEQTAVLVSGHLRTEESMFKLTGVWSADGTGSEQGIEVAASCQALFAAESAHHGWRGEQWEQRLVRSVPAAERSSEGGNRGRSGDSEGQGGRVRPTDGLLSAVEECLEAELAPMSRLAVWGHVLAPGLAARYHSHRQALAPAADGGIDRLLGICTADLQRGVTEAVSLLRAHCGTAGAETTAQAVHRAVRAYLAGGDVL